MRRSIVSIFLFFVAICSLLTSCASIKGNGKYADPVAKVDAATFAKELSIDDQMRGDNVEKKVTGMGLLVSGSENTSLASAYFTMVDFTFENKGAEWLRIKKVAIDFGSPVSNADVRFPVGQDLLDWAESAQQIKAIRDYNMQMALGAAAGAGIAMSGSGSSSGRNAGLATTAGAGMVLAASNISEKLDSIQRARVVPEGHLLSGPFAVPPGLHKQKWLTLYVQKPDAIPFLKKIALTFTYENGATESVLLRLRNPLTSTSVFQKKHPEVKAAKAAAEQKKIM